MGHFAIGEIPYSKMLAYHKNRLGAGRNRRIPCKRRDDGSKKNFSFLSNPKKRSLLRIFDDIFPEDQTLTLDFVKILKKNRDEKEE